MFDLPFEDDRQPEELLTRRANTAACGIELDDFLPRRLREPLAIVVEHILICQSDRPRQEEEAFAASFRTAPPHRRGSQAAYADLAPVGRRAFGPDSPSSRAESISFSLSPRHGDPRRCACFAYRSGHGCHSRRRTWARISPLRARRIRAPTAAQSGRNGSAPSDSACGTRRTGKRNRAEFHRACHGRRPSLGSGTQSERRQLLGPFVPAEPQHPPPRIRSNREIILIYQPEAANAESPDGLVGATYCNENRRSPASRAACGGGLHFSTEWVPVAIRSSHYLQRFTWGTSSFGRTFSGQQMHPLVGLSRSSRPWCRTSWHCLPLQFADARLLLMGGEKAEEFRDDLRFPGGQVVLL